MDLDYQSDNSKAKVLSFSPRERGLILLIIAIVMSVLAFGYFVIRENRRSYRAQTRDAVNLKQIGEFCMLYASDHQGRMPDTLGDLESDPTSAPDTLTMFLTGWGQSDTSIPKSNSTQGRAQWINQHVEYSYIGAGKLASDLTARDVLAYDKMNFATANNGMYIVFGDGHVEWVPLADALKLTTHKPATTQTTQPTTEASSPRS